jgi:hypothetical protein
MRSLLCAWRALLFLALNRSTNFWWCAISFCRPSISFSRRSRLEPSVLHERRVVAVVQRHGGVVHVQDVRGDVVEEAVVVRDHDHRAGETPQELLEPADRQDVQVVGRLVEQQHVGRACQHLRQQHAQLEAAGQRGERLPVHLGGQAETLEDGGRARLRRVAVQPLERRPRARRSGRRRTPRAPARAALLLDQHVPQLGVAHQRDG